MAGKEAKNKRKSFRVDTQMKGQYSLKKKKDVWGQCTVVNFSRGGTGLIFHAHEKIDVGSVVHIKVFASTDSEPVYIKGKLQWIKRRVGGFIGGVKW